GTRALTCGGGGGARAGRARGRRITRAPPPPMMKKTSAVSRYRMPIFLWSTVANHAYRPRVSVGPLIVAPLARGGSGRRVARLPASRAPGRLFHMASPPLARSFQRLEVGDEVGHLAAGQP